MAVDSRTIIAIQPSPIWPVFQQQKLRIKYLWLWIKQKRNSFRHNVWVKFQLKSIDLPLMYFSSASTSSKLISRSLNCAIAWRVWNEYLSSTFKFRFSCKIFSV